MLKLYLLRHGRTQFNETEIVQGWNDSPLTQEGIYQARCTGYGLRDTHFDKAYSGDVQRQIDTARAFLSQNKHQTELIPDPHFREMCYGKYEGGTYYDLLNPLYVELNKPYENYEGLYRFYNDIQIANRIAELDETGKTEGIDRTWARFSEGLKMITGENKKGNILISTSSMAIATVVDKLFPEIRQAGLVANASITVLSYDGEYHLEDYNNIQYRQAGESVLLR
ncbi:MAG: histidine phosphatase family protein [Erysipelotrichaceae bacterium]|nr:histidine phosphatase family protein [Erysipelotrichaceae bacterium]